MLPMVQSEPVLFSAGNQPTDGAATPSATLPPSLTPDSDVDELVDIFFDVDVAVNTFSRIESCELQLGDTWRGTQGKMSVTAPVKKIRKKSDNKPQSQINKCHNEKRRRELENETINQLEELLPTCLAEVKQPDKNGIVREATRQIEEVLKKRRECPVRCPLNAQCVSPVQGGEVTSTQTHDAHYSELTTLIEALKHYTSSLGWVLLEINSRGEIECVTENIKEIVQLDRTELYNKSIFSILHINDHSKLRPLLRNTQSYGWAPTDADKKVQSIQARFAINNSNGDDFTSFVECVIHCARARGTSEAGSVMCVIRRLHDASAALLPVDSHQPAAARPDQIVFRLDSNFTILSCDLSGVENNSNYQVSLVGRRYLELVESADRWHVSAHLQRAGSLPAPPAVSRPFRLRLLPPPRAPIAVRAHSRLFRAKPSSDDPDFIMSTHALLPDDELDDAVSPLAAEPTQPSAPPGGPLMTSVADTPPPSERRYRSDSAAEQQYNIGDLDLDPWASTFQQLAELPEEPKEKETGSAVASPAPPTPTPQPEEPNRLRSLLSMKPHGSEQGGSNNRILKDLLKQEDEEMSAGEQSAPHTPASAMSPRLPHAQLSQQHNSDAYLIKMINDKTDDENDERRNENRGPQQPSALLCQLLSSNGPSNGRHDAADNYLERIGSKRKMESDKGNAMKRATPDNQHVSSSAVATASTSTTTSPASSSPGMSPLCQKNQILVSLLARQQTTPTTPLPLPNPSLRPYGPTAPRPRPPPPQHQHQPRHMGSTLTNMLNANNRVNGGGGLVSAGVDGAGGMVPSHLQMVLQGGSRPTYPMQIHYTSAPYNNQSGNSRAPNASSAGDSEVPNNDKALSDLLDEVINHMPDSDRPAPEVHVLLDLETSQQIRPEFAVMKEKNDMINAIRQSLMQCETKSPVSSPSAPPGYPGQSVVTGTMSGAGAGAGAGYPGGRDATLLSLGEQQQRARLLQLQQSQQMLVSPQAAEQPQADLGCTINTLAPPNVSLTRTGYHHQQLYHSGHQMPTSYGTNKITSSQQNPMLSRQLSGPNAGGYAHNPATHPAAALHTPLTPPPFHRPPRPHLVGGYYEEGGAYCAEYARRPPPRPTRELAPCAGNGSGMVHSGAGTVGGTSGGTAGGTSEYVRNELRAVVGARASRPDMMHQADMDPLMAFDMPPSGGGNVGVRADAPGSWDAQQASPSTTEAGSEAADGDGPGRRETGDPAKASSLLQKLLSL